MTNYEKRLLKFLQDNPTLRLTPKMIAGVWQRKYADVRVSANILLNKSKIKELPDGVLKLNTCEGMGIA